MQNAHAISLLTGIYENKAFRFAIYPDSCKKFINFPFLENNVKLNSLTIHRDAEGMLRSTNRTIKFLFKPPTGNFSLHLPKNHTLTGNLQTGNFGNPVCVFQLLGDDIVLGFGAANGNRNRNNSCFQLLNIDTLLYSLQGASYSSFPFFIIKRGKNYFGVLLNSTLPFRICCHTKSAKKQIDPFVEFRPMADEVRPLAFDFVVFTGTPAEILVQYSDLTGKPFLPPLWSLGLHQSRWSYKTQERVLEIADRYRKEEIPCDVIHLDIHYMNKYRVFSWHPKRFSNPDKMHEQLNQQEFRTICIIDPGVSSVEDYRVAQECFKENYFCFKKDGSPYLGHVWPGKTMFPDFTRKPVRDWWARQHSILFDSGVSGFWNDMNDPTFKMGRNIDPLNEDIRHQDHSHVEIRNQYANYMAMATKDSFAKFKPGERSFVLTRSATCGIQSLAALWTGDNLAKWNHLRQNLYMVLNLGLSGVPFSGADIGGFAGGLPFPGLLKILKIKKNKELFSRWIELGSMMPFCRIHTAIFSYDQEPWSFGNAVLDGARKHIRRRYRLLPYIYRLFVESSLSGAPIVRHLFYDFPDLDGDVIYDQFMLGPSLLVCPVMHKKMKKRKVFLPKGEWYDYETGKKYKGDMEIELDVAPGYYPLFVKAGTALPVRLSSISTHSTMAGPLIWEIYPAPKITGSVILDDGLTQYKNNPEVTKIEITATQKTCGDLEIKQRFVQSDYLAGLEKILIRLPSEYRQISWKNKKSDYSNADLLREDRLSHMNEFELPIGNGTFHFPFKSRNFQ